MNPTAFYDAAQAALDCICSQMDSLAGEEGVPEGYGCPCRVYVSAGEPELNCCTDPSCTDAHGQLTVHVEDVFPSDEFPNPLAAFEPCKASAWATTLVVTVARCAPVLDAQGNPADPDDLSANALLMAVDQYAVMTALSCCLVDDPPAGKRKRRVQIQASRPLLTEGGCAAVEIRAVVDAGVVCGCVSGS